MRQNRSTSYLELSEIRILQIEPTSRCNLLCPQCMRVDKGALNPLLPLTDLTLSDYDNIFTDEITGRLKCVIFNGSYGDPVAGRHTDGFIDRLLQKNIALRIFTNGSLKSASYWRRLGKQFSGTKSEVVFSIDGLGSLNGFYRKGSDFKKIMENAAAFIQEGGAARWDFLIFQHNRRQVEEAKALAKKMGFKKFQAKQTQRFVRGDFTHRIHSDNIFDKKRQKTGVLKQAPDRPNDFEKVIEKYGSYNNYINRTAVRCKYKHDMKALFIDFEALVWPCCWTGAPAYSLSKDSLQKKQFEDLKKRYEPNFNSLRHRSLAEILSHPWFAEDMTQSWKNKMTDSNPKLFTCGRTCGTDYEYTSGTGYKNSKMFVF